MRPQAGQQCSVVPHTGTWIEIMKKKQLIERISEHFDLKLNHNVGKTDGS